MCEFVIITSIIFVYDANSVDKRQIKCFSWYKNMLVVQAQLELIRFKRPEHNLEVLCFVYTYGSIIPQVTSMSMYMNMIPSSVFDIKNRRCQNSEEKKYILNQKYRGSDI